MDIQPHALRVVFFALAAICAACGERPRFDRGDECELNTECKSPLVCRLGHCRVECQEARDCGEGFECVYDREGLGACQLEQDTMCAFDSDCAEGLVCRSERCTNECEGDRDCPPGSVCITDAEGSGCHDLSMEQCQYSSECATFDDRFVCALDHRCREQCRIDWDCRIDQTCVQASTRYCQDGPRMDGGMPDAGPDAGMDAGPIVVVPPEPPRLSARFAHTCFVTDAGRVACWGANTQGQIGDGTMNPALTAVTLAAPTGVTIIGTGAGHTCAVASDGLYCWGDNSDGQIGTGAAMARYLTPQLITLPGTVVDLSLGNNHTCAIVDGGRLYCWGGNDNGELGGATENRATPQEVTGFSRPLLRVATHTVHTCARLDDDTVSCVGQNDLGQLGIGMFSAPMLTPQPVPGLNGVAQVSVGEAFSCALRLNGQVMCWGDDAYGAVGNGDAFTEIAIPYPVLAPVPDIVRQVVTGGAHTCARTDPGIYCWGLNSDNQTGSPSLFPLQWPTPIAAVGVVEDIAAGSTHSCVTVDSTVPTIRCFGDNMSGQLGNNMTGTGGATPVTVVFP